ncbi:hypothetical protein B0T19DRAFT_236046 [Cercophora scortea]|uniref:Secreted protein n=1 Tax=Cercophora scortea TaxID=314031 RepID=A0AAE0M9S6_9PEZI|nr:hypothetical protein B0T19DRAFT_236046 [Cercophora scortea]
MLQRCFFFVSFALFLSTPSNKQDSLENQSVPYQHVSLTHSLIPPAPVCLCRCRTGLSKFSFHKLSNARSIIKHTRRA